MPYCNRHIIANNYIYTIGRHLRELMFFSPILSDLRSKNKEKKKNYCLI